MKCWKIMVLALLVLCLAGMSEAGPNEIFSENGIVLDYTEGGHYDTDFGANFMSEWWYQNGDMRLVSEDGEQKNMAFLL